MRIFAVLFGLLLLLNILFDSFETMVLPRRIKRRIKLSLIIHNGLWTGWVTVARFMRSSGTREVYLSYFGPLLLLFMLASWAIGLIVSFALIQWGISSSIIAPEKIATFETYLYMSGSTFFTLGLGDVRPDTVFTRFLAVTEAGIGFGFLALIIGYVPVVYQAFSRREAQITLLDAHAGSPPHAIEWLHRQHNMQANEEEMGDVLHTWELWCADILESHLSYPSLLHYRSQHERQSWLAALTTMLDICALLLVGLDGINIPTARFLFAIARHTAVDLAQIYGTSPRQSAYNRLTSEDFRRLRDILGSFSLTFRREDAEQQLAEMRKLYEPFVLGLADYLLIDIPSWLPGSHPVDDWQTSPWDHFAVWSQTKLEEITHLVIERKRKLPH